MPAAAVIPAPVAYANIVAVKKLVVGFLYVFCILCFIYIIYINTRIKHTFLYNRKFIFYYI